MAGDAVGVVRGDEKPSSTSGRMLFLDGLRGLALIVMVVNHTARWWMDGSMKWGRYWLIYASMTVAAPIFLFLVGFCLPISYAKVAPTQDRSFWPVFRRYLLRGLMVVGAGYLLNLLVFPEDSIWSGGVLQTIGLGIIVAAALLPVMRARWGRYAVAVATVAMYVAFAVSFPALTRWVAAHPLIGRVLFLDFPPWPWIGVVLIGLLLGWEWITRARADSAQERRYFALLGGVGVTCVLFVLAYDWWMQTPDRISFKRDFVLNHHWIPRGVTVAWIIGVALSLLAATYYVMEVKRFRAGWLVILGQTALMLYFVHQLIVLTLVKQRLGLIFNHWGRYWAANAILMVVLVGLAYLWLYLKRAGRNWQAERRRVGAPRPA